ncbi:MAG TPA: hypothetical protein VGD56_04005, partial [Gemmatirosa sp.]
MSTLPSPLPAARPGGVRASFALATAVVAALAVTLAACADPSTGPRPAGPAGLRPDLAIGAAATFAATGAVQTYTVAVTGVYALEARGAAGGGSVNLNTRQPTAGGAGAAARGQFRLVQGTILTVVVGQVGAAAAGEGAGGGGGSFVYLPPAGTSTGGSLATPTPLVVAGGGGGAQFARAGSAALAVPDGRGGTPASGSPGGTGGAGGTGGVLTTPGVFGGGGGGAGLLGPGSDGDPSTNA